MAGKMGQKDITIILQKAAYKKTRHNTRATTCQGLLCKELVSHLEL